MSTTARVPPGASRRWASRRIRVRPKYGASWKQYLKNDDDKHKDILESGNETNGLSNIFFFLFTYMIVTKSKELASKPVFSALASMKSIFFNEAVVSPSALGAFAVFLFFT